MSDQGWEPVTWEISELMEKINELERERSEAWEARLMNRLIKERDRLQERLAEVVAETAEAWAEIERLRQYEPPLSFQGTEIVWDDTRRAIAERDEARAAARVLLGRLDLLPEERDELLKKWPWLKE